MPEGHDKKQAPEHVPSTVTMQMLHEANQERIMAFVTFINKNLAVFEEDPTFNADQVTNAKDIEAYLNPNESYLEELIRDESPVAELTFEAINLFLNFLPETMEPPLKDLFECLAQIDSSFHAELMASRDTNKKVAYKKNIISRLRIAAWAVIALDQVDATAPFASRILPFLAANYFAHGLPLPASIRSAMTGRNYNVALIRQKVMDLNLDCYVASGELPPAVRMLRAEGRLEILRTMMPALPQGKGADSKNDEYEQYERLMALLIND